ncbi:MAG: 3D domain-containing protein [Sporolactobacillus sp.]
MQLKRMSKAASILFAAGLVMPLASGSTWVHAQSLKGTSMQQSEQKIKAQSVDKAINDLQKKKLAVRSEQLNHLKAEQENRQKAKVKQPAPKAAVQKVTTPKKAIVQSAKPVVKQPTVKKTAEPSAVQHPVKSQTVADQTKQIPVKKAAVQKPVVKQSAQQSSAANQTDSTKPVVKTVQPAEQTKALVVHSSESTTQTSTVQNQKPAESAAQPAQKEQTTNGTNQNRSSSSKLFVVTAYSLEGTTATGVDLKSNPNTKVIAVDPSVIPLGSKVTINGLGTFTAADTGGAIRGKRIDVHVGSNAQAMNFGRQTLNVTVNN